MAGQAGLLELSAGSELLLGGTGWTVAAVEGQRSRVLLRSGGEERWRSIRWLAHHPDCRAVPGDGAGASSPGAGRQPPVLDDLTDLQRQVVWLRVAHLMEAETGFRSGAPSPIGPVPDASSPQQAQREEAVLAGLLSQRSDHIDQILDVLDERDIGDPYRRAMTRAARDMHTAGMAVDALTLDWELAQRGLPLVRQPEQGQHGETYAMRLARSSVDADGPFQAARELAAPSLPDWCETG
jgi:hypothetical protein